MSARTRTEVPCRSLAEYVRALLDALAVGDTPGYVRLRSIVQNRRAIIQVDDETVEVVFDGPAFRVDLGRSGQPVDGVGVTSRQTVIDLLRGTIEVSEAILTGRLDVHGTVDEIARMFHALQVLVDSSTRVPALQRLARDYVSDPCEASADSALPPSEARNGFGAFSLRGMPEAERTMLARLDLLP